MSSEAELERRAAVGDAQAQFALGRFLLNGARAPADASRALALIEQAAAAGDSAATEMTALFEAMGVDRPPDWSRALDRLELAAKQGSTSALLQLRLLARDSSGAQIAESDLRSRIDLPSLFSSGTHQVLSQTPRVRVIERFASAAECNWLIDRARGLLSPASVFHPDTGELSFETARTNSGAEFQVCDMDLVLEMIRVRISTALRIPLLQLEPTQVLHYAPGQEFRPHVDFMDPSNPAYRERLRTGQRIGTFLVYLNEEFEGGETEFVDAGLKFRGRIGDAIFWANVDAQRRPDPLTRHAGLPPTSGEKWILSQWVRDRPGQAR